MALITERSIQGSKFSRKIECESEFFFEKKSEANLLLLNAKKSEANPFQKIAKKMRKSYKKCEKFSKIVYEVITYKMFQSAFFMIIKVSRVSY